MRPYSLTALLTWSKRKREDTLYILITYYVPDTIVHFFFASHIIDLSQLFHKVGIIYQYSTNEKTGAQKG